MSVQGFLEGEAKIRIQPGQRWNLPGRPVVVVNDVLVSIGRVKRVILLRAESEQGVAVVDVDPQRIDGGDHRVNADVKFVAVN